MKIKYFFFICLLCLTIFLQACDRSDKFLKSNSINSNNFESQEELYSALETEKETKNYTIYLNTNRGFLKYENDQETILLSDKEYSQDFFILKGDYIYYLYENKIRRENVHDLSFENVRDIFQTEIEKIFYTDSFVYKDYFAIYNSGDSLFDRQITFVHYNDTSKDKTFVVNSSSNVKLYQEFVYAKFSDGYYKLDPELHEPIKISNNPKKINNSNSVSNEIFHSEQTYFTMGESKNTQALYTLDTNGNKLLYQAGTFKQDDIWKLTNTEFHYIENHAVFREEYTDGRNVSKILTLINLKNHDKAQINSSESNYNEIVDVLYEKSRVDLSLIPSTLLYTNGKYYKENKELLIVNNRFEIEYLGYYHNHKHLTYSNYLFSYNGLNEVFMYDTKNGIVKYFKNMNGFSRVNIFMCFEYN